MDCAIPSITFAPYGICRCDAAGLLLDTNPELVTILGYSSSIELVGRHLANQYTDIQEWFNLADRICSFKRFHGLVAEWVRKDGTSVIVRLSGRNIHGEGNAGFFELCKRIANHRPQARTRRTQLKQIAPGVNR